MGHVVLPANRQLKKIHREVREENKNFVPSW